MATVRTRCQQRANMENDASISTSEWNTLISEAYGELYEEVANSGLRYFETSQTFTTTGLGYLAEPTDHLATIDNLEIVIDTASGRCRRIYPVQPQERSMLSGRTGDPRRYEMVDDRFYLYPSPPSGVTITLRYIAQSPDLSGYADVGVVDVVNAGGEAFILWAVAVKAMAKDKQDVQLAITEREAARTRLAEWARNRAFHENPRRIVEDDFSDDIGDWWGWT